MLGLQDIESDELLDIVQPRHQRHFQALRLPGHVRAGVLSHEAGAARQDGRSGPKQIVHWHLKRRCDPDQLKSVYAPTPGLDLRDHGPLQPHPDCEVLLRQTGCQPGAA